MNRGASGPAPLAGGRAERQPPAWSAWLWWLAFAAGVGLLWWAVGVAR